jgi:hypothetical protein
MVLPVLYQSTLFVSNIAALIGYNGYSFSPSVQANKCVKLYIAATPRPVCQPLKCSLPNHMRCSFDTIARKANAGWECKRRNRAVGPTAGSL